MDKKKHLTLRTPQICAIIKSCSAHGVREIEYGALRIKFSSKDTEEPSPQAIAGLNNQQAEETERQAVDDAEAKTKAEQLDHMLVEDPVQYERLMLEGELEDGHSRTESAV